VVKLGEVALELPPHPMATKRAMTTVFVRLISFIARQIAASALASQPSNGCICLHPRPSHENGHKNGENVGR